MTTSMYIDVLHHIRALVNEALGDADSNGKPSGRGKAAAVRVKVVPQNLSFDMNILAFMNKYAKGLKGPQKYALLLARMAKGNTSTEVSYQDIKSQWNKMRTVLGGPFNPVHGNRAKAMGWVDSEKHGKWKLTSSWKEVLGNR
jgi:hypothetical protein